MDPTAQKRESRKTQNKQLHAQCINVKNHTCHTTEKSTLVKSCTRTSATGVIQTRSRQSCLRRASLLNPTRNCKSPAQFQLGATNSLSQSSIFRPSEGPLQNRVGHESSNYFFYKIMSCLFSKKHNWHHINRELRN